MTRGEQASGILEQLLELHALDQEIAATERELDRCRSELATIEGAMTGMRADLESAESEIDRLRAETRASERAVAEKRQDLDRLRVRINAVKNQRQYSAANFEYDTVRRDLRSLEDQTLERMQKVEDLEAKRDELRTRLESGEAEEKAREELSARIQELEDELAVKQDRRENLAIRVDPEPRQLYDRLRTGRADVVLAPLSEEGVCGNCFTAVPAQQQVVIRAATELVCCQGCGVILYPADLES